MPAAVHREELCQLLAAGAQLVEVLPAAEYDDEHLTGARNIPLKALGPDTVADLDRSAPIVVYCWDGL